MATLLILLEIYRESTKLAAVVINSMTPAQQEKAWDRHFARTEWIQKLLEKNSDRLEKVFKDDEPPAVPPKPRGVKAISKSKA